jgi:hypothetical protein
VTTGAAADTHSSVAEGLVPSKAKRTSCSCNRALVLSRAIPVLSPRRRECAGRESQPHAHPVGFSLSPRRAALTSSRP